MDCVECQMMSSEDIDGELPEEKTAHMLEHLARCRECKADYERTLLLRDRLNEGMNLTRTINIPADFSSKVISLIEKEDSYRSYPQELKALSFINRFIAKTSFRPLSATPVFSFSAVAVLVITVSIALYFYTPSPKHFALKTELTDATKLSSKILKVKNIKKRTVEKDLNFYAKKHAETRFGTSAYIPNPGTILKTSFSVNR